MSGDSESFKEGEAPEANSYIYAKFSLPRGRMLDHEPDTSELKTPHIAYEQPKVESNVVPVQPKPKLVSRFTEGDYGRVSTDSLPVPPPPMPAAKDNHRHSMTSMNTQNSGSTIKASAQKRPSSSELTPEDHLTKGIACHEKGSLN